METGILSTTAGVAGFSTSQQSTRDARDPPEPLSYCVRYGVLRCAGMESV